MDASQVNCPTTERRPCAAQLGSFAECGTSVPRPGALGLSDACRRGYTVGGADIAAAGPCIDRDGNVSGLFVADCASCAPGCP
jgi:hypothetical protein